MSIFPITSFQVSYLRLLTTVVLSLPSMIFEVRVDKITLLFCPVFSTLIYIQPPANCPEWIFLYKLMIAQLV